MTQPTNALPNSARIGELIQDFLGTVDYAVWKGQTVAVNLDTMTVVREASCAEIAMKYGENFVVVCFGKIDAALRPKRVR